MSFIGPKRRVPQRDGEVAIEGKADATNGRQKRRF
jgi:hypothetical protein